MDLSFMLKVLPRLLLAMRHTLFIALTSMVIALALAILIAIIIQNKVRVASQICKVYVSFFRGTPALVQLYLIYFGLGSSDIPVLSQISAYTAVIVVLSLNMAAYMSETIRGALESVDKGQTEASLSIGHTSLQTFRRVTFPQAFRVAVPSLSNSFVDLIKGSSMAFTIGVAEIMATAQLEAVSAYKFFESFMAAALVYWGITLTLNFLQKKLETHLNKAY